MIAELVADPGISPPHYEKEQRPNLAALRRYMIMALVVAAFDRPGDEARCNLVSSLDFSIQHTK